MHNLKQKPMLSEQFRVFRSDSLWILIKLQIKIEKKKCVGCFAKRMP